MTGGKTGGSPAFVHPQAICESTSVGAGTRVWAFAHVLPGAVLGADCNVCDHVFIENDVRIGDRVTIKSGVQLWDGLRIADDVFIGPNATFSNDKFPRSKAYQSSVPVTTIGRGASIGAGAVVLPGLKIGARAMIGAGAVVTRDVPAKAIVSGNPARIVGYADTKSADVREPAPSTGVTPGSITATSVRGVTVHGLTLAEDLRGRLAAGEFGKDIPFTPKRYFMVFDVPGKEVRGEHAHRECTQFLVCVRGSLSVMVDDGSASEEVELREPHVGVLIPPMVWAVQYKYSEDAVLLVFASEHYDANDYIRDYEEFRALAAQVSANRTT
ncbi:MAG TPA: WxcM-like domain-containing protein [Vicinamibacterales bacterium]|nr:WxcM-like domain-containing protein [Vicinamibacterales bacterium]